MELWDIYDENKIKTGRTMYRGEPFKEGDHHLVVHICVFNSNGKMLIQQRQLFKKGWSNMWDITVGGSSVSGETSKQAAIRETSEEVGILLEPTELRQVISINFDVGFDDYYVVNKDVDPDTLALQYEEVQRVKWADINEIFALIDKGDFLPYHKSFIELLFHFRNNIGTLTGKDPTRKAGN